MRHIVAVENKRFIYVKLATASWSYSIIFSLLCLCFNLNIFKSPKHSFAPSAEGQFIRLSLDAFMQILLFL